MKVWTHLQAILHAVGVKYDLLKVQDVSSRITPYLIPVSGFWPELVDPITLNLDGNVKQLWALAAAMYFQNPERALL